MSVTAQFMISAAHKSSGKTVLSTGLAAALAETGKKVVCFKKGPDYIDPMWLSKASGRAAYNLDFNVQSEAEIIDLAARKAGEVSLIEANKGLFDGVEPKGSDSNAALAKMLDVPVVLVIDTVGMTRGIAPLLLGYQGFDRGVTIAGVILNKVGGPRHEAKLRAAISEYTDMPLFGAVQRNPDLEIGERHLGLTTPDELDVARLISAAGGQVKQDVDLDGLLQACSGSTKWKARDATQPVVGLGLRIGVARDKAFGFYYADDMDRFAEFGATLVPIDFLNDVHLPEIDGLFIGGGFPEMHMKALEANLSLRSEIFAAAENGLPVYAECGGLMYLCKRLTFNGETSEMAGVIDADMRLYERPQGRGYVRFSDRSDHPWPMQKGDRPAHEFHYARLENAGGDFRFGRDMSRGYGIDGMHDAIVTRNVVAGFAHLRHTDATPWIARFLEFVHRSVNSHK